jgi:hypothetical protein
MLPNPDVLRRVSQRFPDQALGGRFKVLCGEGQDGVSLGSAKQTSSATTTMLGFAALKTAAVHPVAEQHFTPQPACALTASSWGAVLSAQSEGICTVKPP